MVRLAREGANGPTKSVHATRTLGSIKRGLAEAGGGRDEGQFAREALVLGLAQAFTAPPDQVRTVPGCGCGMNSFITGTG